jgi:hypothetical protein
VYPNLTAASRAYNNYLRLQQSHDARAIGVRAFCYPSR